VNLQNLKDRQMKLAEIDVHQLVHALGMERSAWIKLKTEENRQLTEAEKATVCMLGALEHVLSSLSR
jgi:hypothetical protein